MAKLAIMNGPDAGRTFTVEGSRAVVGRGDQCDMQVLENSISRQHATIEQADGAWRVTDMGSQNGLFVAGQRVGTVDLVGDARFRLGNVELAFSADGEPPVPEPRPPEAVKGEPKAPPSEARTEPDVASARPRETARAKPHAHKTRGKGVEPKLDEAFVAKVKEMASIYPAIEDAFGRIIVGQRQVLDELLIAIAANGHCLMVGLPGLAKTLMVHTLAQILQLTFKRIQFTPDLMPSDILGTDVLDVNETSGEKSFRFIKGPVFTNMLLADEINRTPPKTQAALLESMQERQVTISNHLFPLPQPFFVLATQNPLEQEGTYPLPEAQLDRFMFNITVGYPTQEEEEQIVEKTTGKQDLQLSPILPAEDLLMLQETVRDLPVSQHVIKYATTLARATRPENDTSPQFIKDHVFCGAGPRAAQNLILGAKSRAVIHGRFNVSCDDVRALALPVMRHRIFTNFTADSEGVTPDDLVKQLLDAVEEPAAREY